MRLNVVSVLAGSTVGVYVFYKLCDKLLMLPRIPRYSGRYILVTGCGSGLGLDLVKRLDALGCHVFAGCRRDSSVAELAEFCSDRVLPIQMDVSKPDSVRKALGIVTRKLEEDGKELWAVVNNAAIVGVNGPLEWLTLDDYRSTADANLYGLIDVTMTFLPLIKKSRGRVVNVSSLTGFVSLPGFSAYSITKYGVEAFSEELRRSMRPYRGLRVSIVEPGYNPTNFPKSVIPGFDTARNQASADIQQEFGEQYYTAMRGKTVEQFHKSFFGNITDVTNALEHAILGRYTRARYAVGLDTRLVFVPLSWMPEWLTDWLLELFVRSPLPAVLERAGRL